MPSTLSHAVVGLAVAAWCRPATSAPRVLATHGQPIAERSAKRAARLFAMFALATASHGVFDAMTSYSIGVAFFAPFSLL